MTNTKQRNTAIIYASVLISLTLFLAFNPYFGPLAGLFFRDPVPPKSPSRTMREKGESTGKTVGEFGRVFIKGIRESQGDNE